MNQYCDDLVSDIMGIQSRIKTDMISKFITLIFSVAACAFILLVILEKLPPTDFLELKLSTIIEVLLTIIELFFAASLWIPIHKYKTLNNIMKEVKEKFKDSDSPCCDNTCYMINRTIIKML